MKGAGAQVCDCISFNTMIVMFVYLFLFLSLQQVWENIWKLVNSAFWSEELDLYLFWKFETYFIVCKQKGHWRQQ